MNTKPDVESLIRRTKQYEFADGLRDLQLAVLLVGFGATSWFTMDHMDVWAPWVERLGETFGRWASYIILLIPLAPSILALASLILIHYVRRRWLWQKTGVVKPRQVVVPRRASLIAAAILVVSIITTFGLNLLGVVHHDVPLRTLIAATGWALGCTFVGLGQSVGLERYTRLGLIGGLASTAFLVAPLTFGQAMLALGLGWGLALGVIGMAALWRTLGALRAMQEAGGG